MHPDIERFVEEFRDTSFSHSDQLMAGLNSGRIQIHNASEESSLPASHYLDIYRFRLKHINHRYGSRHTIHTESLANDIRQLIDGLRQCPDEKCDLWMFTEKPHFNYSVWIGRESRTVFGCILAVDNRLVTPEL